MDTSFRRLLAAALLAGCVTLLVATGLTWRMDAWLYDAATAGAAPAADRRILIVAIDGDSLAEVGRWPWRRGVHADMVDRLGQAGAAGIVLNVLFAEPADDPADDARLADALRRAGTVTLPMAAEPAGHNGVPIETLPVAGLIPAAAALGHVDVEIGRDGVVRSAYLRAGLGSARWPALALAGAGFDPDGLPGLVAPGEDAPRPFQWVRDRHVLVPYAHPGAFAQVSAAELLRGDVDPAAIAGRWVFVGTTAAGLDPALKTPGTRQGPPLPSIEYHANLLNAMLQERMRVPLGGRGQWTLSIALVLLPVLLTRQRSRWLGAGAATAIGAGLVLACTAALLYFARVWFPPAAALCTLLAGYVAWTLFRLRRSQRLAHSDALTHLANRRMFDLVLGREYAAAARSGQPLSLLAIDVDHFKDYNDRYGHQAGDDVLRRVGRTVLLHARRPRDLAARYGGDELMVVLPETGAADAARIAEAIVADVRALDIPHPDAGGSARATVSIGVATFVPSGTPNRDVSQFDLVQHADVALYLAKRAGRDCHRGAHDA